MSAVPCSPVHDALAIPNDHSGFATLASLPARRESGHPLDENELHNIITILRAFLTSPNNKSKPGKGALFDAVMSIVKDGTRKLSRAWDKTQLAIALLRWSQEALDLPEPTFD